VENYKGSLHFTAIMNRLEHARWKQDSSATLQEQANRRVRDILARHRPAELPADVARAVRAVASRRDRGA
jgi:trimethylamine:corrinoid methyltransferase-like protein